MANEAAEQPSDEIPRPSIVPWADIEQELRESGMVTVDPAESVQIVGLPGTYRFTGPVPCDLGETGVHESSDSAFYLVPLLPTSPEAHQTYMEYLAAKQRMINERNAGAVRQNPDGSITRNPGYEAAIKDMQRLMPEVGQKRSTAAAKLLKANPNIAHALYGKGIDPSGFIVEIATDQYALISDLTKFFPLPSLQK